MVKRILLRKTECVGTGWAKTSSGCDFLILSMEFHLLQAYPDRTSSSYLGLSRTLSFHSERTAMALAANLSWLLSSRLK